MGKKAKTWAAGNLDVPLPAVSISPEALLETKLGSRAAAGRAIAAAAEEIGTTGMAHTNVLASLALVRLGADLDQVAKSLRWDDFERFCASAIASTGYDVSTNVRLKKPTRQLDVVAESPALVLAVDCKHWMRGSGVSRLAKSATAQAERARNLARTGRYSSGKRILPVLLTLADDQVRVVEGVPVVPLHSLKGFLSAVSGFHEGLAFVDT